MRKYIILFFSGLLLLNACKKAPEGIISPDVMTNLLTEVHLADGAIGNIPQIPDSIYKYGMGKYLEIFKKYHTDTAQFRKSYKYYTMHPDQMVSIYDAVLKKLTAKNDSVTALIAKNNTAQMKKNKNMPANPVGGKYTPGSTVPQPMHPPVPAKPGVPETGMPLKRQMMERMQLHRDSMLKKLSKKPHAVPLQ